MAADKQGAANLRLQASDLNLAQLSSQSGIQFCAAPPGSGSGANKGRSRSSSRSSLEGTKEAQGASERARRANSAPDNRTSDTQTMMHILKANIGTGVLAMPSAFKNVGLWLGFLLLPLIGAICIHCMNVLIACHDRLCDKFNYESLDYDQVATLALASGPRCARPAAKYAGLVVTVFLLLTQAGFCCVYVMFVVENLQLALVNLFAVHYSTTTYLLMVFPLIGLTSCSSNLKLLAKASTLANVLQLLGLSLIFYDLLQFHSYGKSSAAAASGGAPANCTAVHVDTWLSGDLKSGLPLFFSTAVYAFEGIGVVLPAIKEMRNPARIAGINGILNTAMLLIGILYLSMGFFGYAKYGQHVQGSITLNLPETNLNEFIRLIFVLAIGLSYGLQFYIPWTIIWPHIDESLFYSYRPREARDKLGLLRQAQPNAAAAAAGKSLTLSELQTNANSNASTLATSYAFSTLTRPPVALRGQSRHLQPSEDPPPPPQPQQQQQQVARAASGAGSVALTSLEYGALLSPATPGATRMAAAGAGAGSRDAPAPGAGSRGCGQPRNRLEDVMEHDMLPVEVEWRPPPRLMRGKRKLVRYSVILLCVSFSFVAAALIPRLDLFISLIGALASSCLAIIFPAIIQVCTFWCADDADPDEASRAPPQDRYQAACAGHHKLAAGRRKSRDQALKRLAGWWLFMLKNLLLTLFGLLGLFTGGWISFSELMEVYAAEANAGLGV